MYYDFSQYLIYVICHLFKTLKNTMHLQDEFKEHEYVHCTQIELDENQTYSWQVEWRNKLKIVGKMSVIMRIS